MAVPVPPAPPAPSAPLAPLPVPSVAVTAPPPTPGNSFTALLYVQATSPALHKLLANIASSEFCEKVGRGRPFFSCCECVSNNLIIFLSNFYF